MPVLAVSQPPAFAINGFGGLSGAQQLSFWFTFILFNGYVVLEVVCLASFWFAARPRHGSPNPAAVFYFLAAIFVMLSFISMVWAAPAEKSFLDDTGTFLAVGARAVKVFIGIGFSAVAVGLLLVGALSTAARRRDESSAVVI